MPLRGLDRYNLDIVGTLLDGRAIKVVDCGDITGDAHDTYGNRDRSEKVMRQIVGSGVMPIVLGGDHAIPIPVLRAFEGHGPITLIQTDGHLDWRPRRRWPFKHRPPRLGA